MSNSLKLLFLDIDGVCNNYGVHPNGYPRWVSPITAECLNEVLRKVPDAQIVLTGAWRLLFPDVLSIESMLGIHGVDSRGRVHGCTILDKAVHRPSEDGSWSANCEVSVLKLVWKARQIMRYVDRYKPFSFAVIDADSRLIVPRHVLAKQFYIPARSVAKLLKEPALSVSFNVSATQTGKVPS
jgi:hypothetical protein